MAEQELKSIKGSKIFKRLIIESLLKRLLYYKRSFDYRIAVVLFDNFQ